MKLTPTLSLLAITGALCFPGLVQADVKLPKIFSSGMVLQRERPIAVWGTASPGEEVTVRINITGTVQTDTARADAGPDGKWSVTLKPQRKTDETYELTVSGKNTVRFENILLGEVWLCSGQSNMHWTFHPSQNVKDNEVELKSANDPKIRFFTAAKGGQATAQSDVAGQWLATTPENLLIDDGNGMSALAYFFARKLRTELKVPVGLINSSVGGTAIELWTPSPQGTLFNAMIYPIAPYTVRGFLWYQGESNVFTLDREKYADKMKSLITAWRTLWKNENLPFYYVHLAPFSYSVSNKQLNAQELPRLWEGQTKALEIPHTGMAVITDTVDNINDIHPKDKQTVADRLARLALARTYGRKDVVDAGPSFREAAFAGERVEVKFAGTERGLKSRDGKPLTWFTVAGEDKEFHPATAEIVKNQVILTSPQVSRPVAVRFGWHETAMPNLVNSEGLPAVPFRTDRWE